MRPTLIYSGGCKFCRWVVRTIILTNANQRQLDILPLRSPDADWFLGDLPMDFRTSCWWFIDRDGVRWRGHNGGAIRLFKLLWPRWGRLVWTLRLDGFLDWVDCRVKVWRPFLSKWVSDGPGYSRIGPVYGQWIHGDDRV